MKLIFKHFFLIIAFIGVVSCGKDTAIDNTPKPPICLVQTYSSSSGKGGKGATGSYTFVYDDKDKIIQNSTSTIYVEERANLGSDTKPYVIEYYHNELSAKYYCDKNSRLNKKESFISSTDKFPSSISNFEYDNKGYHTKITLKFVNNLSGVFTGNYRISEYEYVGDNIVKYYSTYQSDTEYRGKYLSFSYLIGNIPIKTKIEYLYNYGINGLGENDKFYPSFKIYYNSDGSKSKDGSYVYEFDNNGYIISGTIKYSDGSFEREDYTYQCK